MSGHDQDDSADPARKIGQNPAKPAKPLGQDRAARQAAELRSNLQRRKAQQRQRQTPTS
jgi:hypothetical protein